MAGSAVTNLFLAIGDMQGMERRWQLPVLIMANEASTSPSSSVCIYVCVKSVCRSLCQSAAKAPIPEKPRLIFGTDHCALLVLLIQLSWLNYLPGQETHTHTEKMRSCSRQLPFNTLLLFRDTAPAEACLLCWLTHQTFKEGERREMVPDPL